MNGIVLAIGGWMVTATMQTQMPAARASEAGTGDAVAVPAQRQVLAVRAVIPPRIDGHLDEPVWQDAPRASQFTQIEPVEGAPESERTEVRVLYDDAALYIGARMFDSGPVTRRLGRRDMALAAADWIRVSLDSYRDRRTAFRFDVNPSGARRDATLIGEAAERESVAWDAVWDVATSVDAEGWSAELRIPLSQISFGSGANQTWGIQLERIIDRLQERAVFAFTPRSQAAGIAAFGELTGLEGLRPGRSLELLPYVLGRGLFVNPGQNPYRDDREMTVAAGVDARLRVASNLTLTATANPDFGQVEVDPAVINLTAFETFFSEKRPFFVEGAGSFAFPGPAQLFYSRRIGRRPQLGAPTRAADVPDASSILGAAKLVGRTSRGWSLGILDAVTEAERIRYRTADGQDASALAEPRTNYFVARMQRELRGAQRSVGGLLTAVHRDQGDARADAALRSAAYAGGIDFRHEWAARSWAVSGMLVGSHVRGTPSAITRTQLASTRYFGRPDATHLEVDSSATALSGNAAQLRLTKQAGEHLRGSIEAAVLSPGFEVNDIGFQSRADRIGSSVSLNYLRNRPGHTVRRWEANGAASAGANFGGDWIDRGFFGDVTFQHSSYWSLILGGSGNLEHSDDRLTRGGPLARAPAAWAAGWLIASDPRKPITFSYRTRFEGDALGSFGRQFELKAAARPSPRLSVSAGPVLERNSMAAQYVARVTDAAAAHTYGARYIFAPLEYTELALETRASVSFTPTLSLEVFAQPLLSRGTYGRAHEFTTPGDFELRAYDSVQRVNGAWIIDPDGSDGAASPFSVADPDFQLHSLRGSGVVRWEWRPGSTLFLVWQQARVSDGDGVSFRVRGGASSLVRAQPDNIFVVKVNYWFNPRI